MSDRDVIVVGSGPNGLAAAVALAKEGYRVAVREAAPVIGGGTRTEELTLPGFHHDVCSTIHPMGVASPWFRRLPLDRHGLEWIQPLLSVAHPFDDGSAAVLARDPAITADSLDARDRRAYEALVAPFLPGWRDLLDDILAPPFHVPRHALLLARFTCHALRSASGLAYGRFAGDRARALHLGIASHAAVPLDRSPSAGFALALTLCGHGDGWPLAKGGSQAISSALDGILREHGGEIVTGSEVTSISTIEGARAVLLDLTPRQVERVCGSALPQGYRRRLRRYRYGPGVFKIDWALREPIPWSAEACRRAGTVHLAGSSESVLRSSRNAFAGRREPAPLVLLTQPTLFDASRAPEGRHVAWAYSHVPHGSVDDATAAIEAQVERFAPGFRDVVLARHTMDTRALEAHDANLVGGDIAGGAEDLRQVLARPVLRLDPYATPVSGLYVCSASTPPGGAVHGMCGYHAARSALRGLRGGDRFSP